MKKVFLLIVLSCLCLCGCSSEELVNGDIVNYEEAKELVDNGAFLVDVRSKAEYDAGHIEGAVLIPVDTINEKSVKKEVMTKDTPVIVYCRSGSRSSQAAKMLVNLGYTQVYDLGSMDNWVE